MNPPGSVPDALPSVRHRDWALPLLRPGMANEEDRRAGLGLSNRSLERDGRPWIPVSGELHYSRVPRERWVQRLRLLRSGGVTVVSSYVPWIHHERSRGDIRFDGNLDVAAFVDTVRAEGLELVLRIGPWIHGEVRNGGFPDWVQEADVAHRSDDPGYLALVRDWWTALARALDGRCEPETVLAIQLDNEFYDGPEHLTTLKRLARELGLSAPLWTATAWGGALLPDEEVLPLWGGYGDGFWVDADAPWDPSFRAHYFFSDSWDDPGIGADVRGGSDSGSPLSLSPWFPIATCELGGGMATAYHRRPLPSALDVAAVAHAKLGSGSSWQGYYMYAGGTNPALGLEETQRTGYPNDLPQLSYDFHAPVDEAGRATASHHELRRQHAFIEAFGDALATMSASLPDVMPTGIDDSETLRWSLRSDGTAGFVFISTHQPHVPIPSRRGVRLRLRLADEELCLPSRAIDIPSGTLARWPVGLELGGVRIAWATASALTVLPGEVPTLVLAEDSGVPVEVAVGGGDGPQRLFELEPGGGPLRLIEQGGRLDVLLLAADDEVWLASAPGGARRRLFVCAEELSWDADSLRVEVRSSRAVPAVSEYQPGLGRFTALPLEPAGSGQGVVDVAYETVRSGSPPSGRYGARDGRASAPGAEVFDRHAAVFRLAVPAFSGTDATLRMRWAGDVAQLRVDGRVVADRFWDGSDFSIDLSDCGASGDSLIELSVLPLPAGAPVHLPGAAAERWRLAGPALVSLDGVELECRTVWLEGSR